MLPEALRRAADGRADLAVRAPGRANLIGEHTDYNDGYVLPAALDIATYLVGRRRDGVVKLRSLNLPGEVEVDPRTGEGPQQGWGRYVTAVVRALLDSSVDVNGLEGVVHSEVPIGSGLSSSAALEVTIATALSVDAPDPVAMARICKRAENVYVGVQSGIMDQLVCAAARAEHALLIDCRDDALTHISFPRGVSVLVVDSMVRRGLSDSAYNERREQCRAAAEALGVRALRDVTMADLVRRRSDIGATVFRRARHVVSENNRVLAVVRALQDRNLASLRSLFEESHKSLAEDYGVSTNELDALVDIALSTHGVLAARLTGAGFGGCTVNLVETPVAAEAARQIVERYARTTGHEAAYWISRPARGVEVFDASS